MAFEQYVKRSSGKPDRDENALKIGKARIVLYKKAIPYQFVDTHVDLDAEKIMFTESEQGIGYRIWPNIQGQYISFKDVLTKLHLPSGLYTRTDDEGYVYQFNRHKQTKTESDTVPLA